MIEKCGEYRRSPGPNNYSGDIETCLANGKDMRCSGYSDFCETPSKFRSVRGTPNDQITFKNVS